MCVRGSYLGLVRSTSTDAGAGTVLDAGDGLGVRPPRRWRLDEPRIGPEAARTGSRLLSSTTSIPCEGVTFVVDEEALVTPPEVPRSAQSHRGCCSDEPVWDSSMESRASASSSHGGAWWPGTGGQACQGCAATRGASSLVGLGRTVWPLAQAWGNFGAGEEGPCACAQAWGSAGAREAGPCPRAHAWGSSGGGQQRTQGARQRASLPHERRRRAGGRILGRVTGSAPLPAPEVLVQTHRSAPRRPSRAAAAIRGRRNGRREVRWELIRGEGWQFGGNFWKFRGIFVKGLERKPRGATFLASAAAHTCESAFSGAFLGFMTKAVPFFTL
jgi:hypothetical protein